MVENSSLRDVEVTGTGIDRDALSEYDTYVEVSNCDLHNAVIDTSKLSSVVTHDNNMDSVTYLTPDEVSCMADSGWDFDGLHDTSPIHVGGGDDFGNMSEYGDFDV